MQISEVLNHAFENLDKYKMVTPSQNVEQKKIINPYMTVSDALAQAQDLKTQEKTLLKNSV